MNPQHIRCVYTLLWLIKAIMYYKINRVYSLQLWFQTCLVCMSKYVKVALNGSCEILHDHAEWRFHKKAASILEKINTMMLATISDQNIKHCDQVLKVGFKSSFAADICSVTMETSSQCTGIGNCPPMKEKSS